MVKYDGVRALRMHQFDLAAKSLEHALQLNAEQSSSGTPIYCHTCPSYANSISSNAHCASYPADSISLPQNL